MDHPQGLPIEVIIRNYETGETRSWFTSPKMMVRMHLAIRLSVTASGKRRFPMGYADRFMP